MSKHSSDSDEVGAENVYDFLKRFATDISLADLKPVSRGNLEQLAIIDFADTLMHDPAVDLSEFAIEMYSDLSPDGVAAKKIIDAVLKHYQTDDPALEAKIEFGLLIFTIQRAYQEAVKLIRP